MKRKIKILALPDDADIQMLLKRILEKEGYDLVIANKNQDPIELLRNDSYRLLIMDYWWQRLDWWELYNLMKTDAYLSTIGIIILLPKFSLTAEGARMLDKVLENGDGLLTKPFLIRDFVELIKKVLENYGITSPILE